MALTQAIEQARRANNSRDNRDRQMRAELRLEELLKVDGIADDYESVDRRGDLKIESQFASLYALVDSPEEKEAVAAAFACWMKCEAEEEEALRRSVGSTGGFMRRNNPTWIDGAAVPFGEDGAA